MADEIEFVSDEDVPKMEKVKRKTVSTSKFRFSLQLILQRKCFGPFSIGSFFTA